MHQHKNKLRLQELPEVSDEEQAIEMGPSSTEANDELYVKGWSELSAQDRSFPEAAFKRSTRLQSNLMLHLCLLGICAVLHMCTFFAACSVRARWFGFAELCLVVLVFAARLMAERYCEQPQMQRMGRLVWIGWMVSDTLLDVLILAADDAVASESFGMTAKALLITPLSVLLADTVALPRVYVLAVLAASTSGRSIMLSSANGESGVSFCPHGAVHILLLTALLCACAFAISLHIFIHSLAQVGHLAKTAPSVSLAHESLASPELSSSARLFVVPFHMLSLSYASLCVQLPPMLPCGSHFCHHWFLPCADACDRPNGGVQSQGEATRDE